MTNSEFRGTVKKKNLTDTQWTVIAEDLKFYSIEIVTKGCQLYKNCPLFCCFYNSSLYKKIFTFERDYCREKLKTWNLRKIHTFLQSTHCRGQEYDILQSKLGGKKITPMIFNSTLNQNSRVIKLLGFLTTQLTADPHFVSPLGR